MFLGNTFLDVYKQIVCYDGGSTNKGFAFAFKKEHWSMDLDTVKALQRLCKETERKQRS